MDLLSFHAGTCIQQFCSYHLLRCFHIPPAQIDSHRWHASSRTAPLLLLHRPLHRPRHIRPAILSCSIAESAVARAREYSSTCQTSPSYPTSMRMRPSAGAVGAPWFSSGRRRSENQLYHRIHLGRGEVSKVVLA